MKVIYNNNNEYMKYDNDNEYMKYNNDNEYIKCIIIQ